MAPPFALHVNIDDVMETLFPKGRSNSLRIFSERELAKINGKALQAASAKTLIQPSNPLPVAMSAPASNTTPAPLSTVPKPVAVPETPTVSKPPVSKAAMRSSATVSTPTQVRHTAGPTQTSSSPFKGLWNRMRTSTLPSIAASKPPKTNEKPAPKKRMEWAVPAAIQRLEDQLISGPIYSPQPMHTKEVLPSPASSAKPSVTPMQDNNPADDLFDKQRPDTTAITAPSTTPFQHLSTKLVTADAVNSLLATARLDEMAKDQSNRLLERNKFLSSSINNLAENYFRLQRDAT